MQKSLPKPSNMFSRIKATPLQATLASFALFTAGLALLLPIVILYRDTFGLYALAGIVATGVVAATALRPQLGVYILAVVIFTNLSDVFTDLGLPSINKPLVGLLIVSVLLNSMLSQSHRSLKIKSVEWCMLGYGTVLLASYFVASDQDTSLAIAFDFAKDFIILLCVVYALKSPLEWKHAIWFVIGAMTFICLLCTYQIITGDFDQTFWGLATVRRDQVLTGVWQARLNGPIYDPNFFGQLLVAAFPLAFYVLITGKSWLLRSIGLASTFLITLVNFQTYSRGSFLTMMLIVLLVALERRIHIFWIVLALLSTTLIIPFLPEGYTERLETLRMFQSEGTQSVYKESSFRGRTSEILSGWNMFLDHPILGVGIGNYETRYQEYASELGLETRTTDRQAHSLYVETLAETGLLGIISFTSIFVVLFTHLSHARRKAKQLLHTDPSFATWTIALQMSIIAYLLAGIFLHGDFLRTLWFLVALGVAAIHLMDQAPSTAQQQPRAMVDEMSAG
jgi:hypothetical protein